MYEHIPAELKQFPNWVCWLAVPDKSRGKIKKMPINPHCGDAAQSNNAQTWSDFDTALKASKGFSGLGFMFGDCPFFGVDIDGIANEIQDFKLGELNIVSEFVNSLQSYTELSQSGNGIHIICRGTLPKQGRRHGNIEMYEDGRFFVMTGNSFAEYESIQNCTEKIKPLHEKYIGGGKEPEPKRNQVFSVPISLDEVVKIASNSKTGSKFKALFSGDCSDYNSQSEADMAFCNMLAFWCERDANKMDCIFRQSGLMREKWDRKQSGTTYGVLTLKKAIADCTEIYKPKSSQYSCTIGSPESSLESTQVPSSVQPAAEPKQKLYTFDDMGNAQRFVDLFGETVLHCYIDKSWLYYDSRKWCYDESGTIERLSDRSVEAMAAESKTYAELDNQNGGDMSKQFQKHIKLSRSNKSKKAMLSEVKHYLPILPAQMDRNKMALNTPGGVLDLRNGKLVPHNYKYYLTKITNVEYTDNADCPLWNKFLDDIFAGDKELINYIQKAVGYSLTGSTAEQCAFFLYGDGQNGKSTFLDTMRDIFGDYASNIQPETIMIRNNSQGNINSDIARLKGSRFVTSVEPDEGIRLNEGLIKQLTGDDVVTARKLYAAEFEFKPEFKLWMATNHKPIIRGTDTGIWRRIHMIPFTVKIPPEKRDKHLKSKLMRELPAIFHWAVEGYLKYQSEGLAMPDAVLNTVKEYRKEMDVISAFVESCCIEEVSRSVQASDLYAAYTNWCNEGNEYKMSNTKFGVEVSKRFEKAKLHGKKIYRGISLA